MDNEEQLFTVCCVNCGVRQFKFSQNLLEEYLEIFLRCSECGETTIVRYSIAIEKQK
jgi:uncharacterized Zn finger protein